ncbi:MAG: ABC transporter ATP-binding protein/permease [Oscillospiraceae bacterium]|nr:ABC transporter ATP-binding protein/permease [Oscillospiraceae bacterium]
MRETAKHKQRNSLIQSFGKYVPFAAFSFACIAGEAICELLQPSLLGDIIDTGIAAGDMSIVYAIGLRMLLITLIGMGCAIGRALLSRYASQWFGHDLRLRVYEKIQRVSLATADKYERATLVTRVTNDVQQVQGFTNGMMRFYMRAPILCVGGIIMAVRSSGTLSMVLVIVMPIAAAVVFLSSRVSYPYFFKVQTALDRLGALIREYFSGIRVVKAFNRFGFEKKRFEDANANLSEASRRSDTILAYFKPLVALIIHIGIAAVILIGGWFGEESGKVVAFVNYMTIILNSMSMFSNIINQLVRAMVSGKRINEVLNEENDNADAATGASRVLAPSGDSIGKLIFKNVNFSYPSSSRTAIDDLSFTASGGERIGIIGSTGSGKSTIIRLLLRLYEISSGQILFDGQDLPNISSEAARALSTVVLQSNQLFTGTIRDNIKFGDENASDEEILKALDAAQIGGYVRSLEDGLDAVIGRGGVNVSGGQKQRMTIARALVKLTKSERLRLLLLDDCTSALDAHTEAALMSALLEYKANTITLIVSQRIRTVRNCDKILVMDDGSCCAYGTHDELIVSSEVYRDIYESQIGLPSSSRKVSGVSEAAYAK